MTHNKAGTQYGKKVCYNCKAGAFAQWLQRNIYSRRTGYFNRHKEEDWYYEETYNCALTQHGDGNFTGSMQQRKIRGLE